MLDACYDLGAIQHIQTIVRYVTNYLGIQSLVKESHMNKKNCDKDTLKTTLGIQKKEPPLYLGIVGKVSQEKRQPDKLK